MQIRLGDFHFVYQFSPTPSILNKTITNIISASLLVEKMRAFNPLKGPFPTIAIKYSGKFTYNGRQLYVEALSKKMATVKLCFNINYSTGYTGAPSDALFREEWLHNYNQQNGMCAQKRLRLAWTFAQSDQSLRCLQEESLSP